MKRKKIAKIKKILYFQRNDDDPIKGKCKHPSSCEGGGYWWEVLERHQQVKEREKIEIDLPREKFGDQQVHEGEQTRLREKNIEN